METESTRTGMSLAGVSLLAACAPYASLPAIAFHGVSVNYVIKYPMMFAGALLVMGAFALAYRGQEKPALAPQGAPCPAFGV